MHCTSVRRTKSDGSAQRSVGCSFPEWPKTVGIWPKYKSKRSGVPRFAYTTGSFGLIEDDPKALKLPRIGRVHCMENATERVHGRRIVRMTVSRHAGFWYAALTVERPTESVPAKNRKQKNRNRQVGVDLGVRTVANDFVLACR